MMTTVREIASFHEALAAKELEKLENFMQDDDPIFRDFVGMEFGKFDLANDLKRKFLSGDEKERKIAVAAVLVELGKRSKESLKATVENVRSVSGVFPSLFAFCVQYLNYGSHNKGDLYLDAIGKLLQCVAVGDKELVGESAEQRERLLRRLLFAMYPCLSDEVKKTVYGPDFTMAGVENMKQKDLAPIFNSICEVYKYLYLHPVGRQLYLDHEAKEAQMSSSEYRKKNPWKADEGPNSEKGIKRSTM